jgi:stage II sporulation protein M
MMADVEPGAAAEMGPPLRPGPTAFVRAIYREEWSMWNAHYRRYFKIAARLLGLGFVLAFAYFSLRPGQEQKSLAFVMKSLRDIPLGAPPLVLALTLFYHNARASLLAVAAGGLPYLCLPVLDPLVNGAALGLLASVSKHQGLNVPLLFLKGVAPHGIVELPAVLYATSAGLHLSMSMGKEILAAVRRRRADAAEVPAAAEAGMSPFLSCLATAIRSFVIVVLPLLLFAAFVEAFVTPLF